MSIAVLNEDGVTHGMAGLSEGLESQEIKPHLIHETVVAEMAARRAGTHSTLTRAEARGGGRKPWRQKGTGRSRAGTTRAPGWVGGGVAHGPKPRDYSQRTPKKMIKLALASALSDRAADGNVMVVDKWEFDTPKTKDAIAALAAIGAEGKVLLVLGDGDVDAWKSFRNLTDVHCLHVGELNTYDVLNADVVVFTEATLPTGEPVVASADSAGADSVDSVDSVDSDSADSVDSVDSNDSAEEEE